MQLRGWKTQIAVAAAFVAASAVPAAAQFKDQLVQAPALAAPERGSVKGPLSNLAFTAAELARGGFSLRLPITVPEARGPLQADIFPGYSPEGGLSEWGMGWQTQLQIERRRLVGEIDYLDDDFMSPWGLLRQGTDGFFYPVGLASPTRLERVERSLLSQSLERFGDVLVRALSGGRINTLVDEQDWLATTFDGTTYRFSALDGVATDGGTYSWALTEVIDLAGHRTSLTWTKNSSGRPFLSNVTWAERGGAPQYQVTFTHELIDEPLSSRASGVELTLDRRISTVSVAARDAVTGTFHERWHYTLAYRAAPFGPAFYLETVQRTFASGQSEPAMAYTYELDSTRLPLAQLQHYTGLDAVFQALGQDAVQPDRAGLLDVDGDGRLDLEHAEALTLVKHGNSGWVSSTLPPASGTHPSCRPFTDPSNRPRTLARLTADVGEPHVLFATMASDAPVTSQILVCDRLGHPLADLSFDGDWTLDANTRLVDVDRDRRPDLVHVSGEGVDILRNESDAQGIRFTALPRSWWTQDIEPQVSWLNDFDGDGAIDIVTRTQDGFYVFYGRGQYRWDTPAQYFQVTTSYGDALGNIDDYQATFIDANKDGLADVLLTMGIDTWLFTNRGSSFVEAPVSGFRSVAAEFGVPVVADLTGRGNTEVAFPSLGTTYFVEVANASTGLMAGADDGMGTVARFTYKRSTPVAGFDHRVTLLDSLTLESSGLDPISYTYSYGAPVAHSVNHQLAGFSFAERTSPYLVEHVDFTNDDDVSGLVTKTKAVDGRSSLVRFTEVNREEATLAGIRFLRETSTKTGTRRADGSGELATTVTTEAYSRAHCATKTRSVTPSGTLVTTTTLASISALGTLPHCTAETIAISGTHSDASLDFSYGAIIERNSIGQPTKIRQTSGGSEVVLQQIGYDNLHRPQTVQQPGLGATTLSYEATTGLLREVVAPDNVSTTARARDPLTDGLRELGIDRGASPWVSSFRFDGQERLWKSWDDIGVATESAPALELAYFFAGPNAPGVVQAKQMLSLGSHQESADLSSGTGETLAKLVRIPGAWMVGGLKTINRQQLEARSFWRAPMPAASPVGLSWTALRAGGDQLGLSRMSGGGQETSSDQVVAQGVNRHVEHSEAITGDRIVTTSIENGAITTQVAVDAGGAMRWTKDGSGYLTNLGYDAMGRLVNVTLADGSQQALRYDSFGRVYEVGRPGLTKVRYEYDSVTGLAKRKRIFDGDQQLERMIEWTRDAIGRVVLEQRTQPSRNAAQSISFHYDGVVGATTVPGQRGHLSSVVGSDFSRTARFEKDGSALASSISIGGWRQLEQSWTRYENGATKDETWIVRDGTGQELARMVQTNVFDAFGRLSALRVDGAPFATITYDAEGRLDAAILHNGSEITYLYDSTTHARNGYWMDVGAWNGGVSWSFNNRGLVASETISVGSGVWERAHEYDPRGFLTRSHDEGGESRTTYGFTGLPTSMTDMTGARTIARSGRVISVDSSAGGSYQLDASGRVVSHDGLSLTWGPSGEVDEATRGTRTWSYLYDEVGNRIGKREGGAMVAGYVGGIYIDGQRAILPLKINNQLIGTWQITSSGNTFQPAIADPRGTVLGESGIANLASPYGMRVQRPAQSAALDYVERGYDNDLRTVRFGVRDYDPKLGQFWSPDPLFLEDMEKCAESSTDCNLYGYAKSNPLTWIDQSGKQPDPRIRWGALAHAPEIIKNEINSYEFDPEAAKEMVVVGGVTVLAGTLCGGICAFAVPMIFAANEEEVGAIAIVGAIGGGTIRPPKFAWGTKFFTRGVPAAEARTSFAQATKSATNKEIGDMVRWPKGLKSIEKTLDMAKSLTAADVKQMQSRGLTRAIAESAREMYVQATKKPSRLDNDHLLPRLGLMDKILEIWDQYKL